MDIKIDIPKNVENIIEILEGKGFEAYIVGGCVRDSLLGISPKDYDITTNALPQFVMSLFPKVILTGIEHGTVTVNFNNENYEVTTFRNDGEYKDGRHPEKVEFVSNLNEDLQRRDFTINAMVYNPKTGFKDYFNGLKDLKSNVIRTVGNPEKRFKEDGLRMMRAVRFSAQLNFTIEENTFNAIKKLNFRILKVSKERIRDEFNKILLYNPEKLIELKNCGLLELIIQDINKTYEFNQNNKYHKYNLFEHSVLAAKNIEPKLYLRLTMLLHDFGKIDSEVIDSKGISHFYGHEKYSQERALNFLKLMKYDNKTIKKVYVLIKYHDCRLEDKISVKNILNKIGLELFKDLIKIKKADLSAKNLNMCREAFANIIRIENYLKEILDNNECYSISQLAINGKDLMELAIEGKKIGEVLEYILKMVINDNNLNKREILIKLVELMRN